MNGAQDRTAPGSAGAALLPAPPLLFEQSVPGRTGVRLAPLDVPRSAPLPDELLRAELPLPELSEAEVVRHFTNVSRRNFSVDQGFYPLGSCTMKYNPKINDRVADLPGLAAIHPYQDEATVQGALRLLWELQEWLGKIAGLPAVSLQPSAGAHGELTGALIIRAFHAAQGRQRTTMLVPDSAHGTNPATAAMAGYRSRTVPTGADGSLDFAALQEALDDDVAGLMITNPNTLGLFVEHINDIAAAVHAAGGLVYMDGANMNAMTGVARPGDLGTDILHFNLHKTFSVPHGGGGPGAGATAVTAELARFLPPPVVCRDGDRYRHDYQRPHSIGRVRAFYGNVNNSVRGYAYLRSLGGDGLAEMSRLAVLNANYLRAALARDLELPYPRICKHEAVFSARHVAQAHGVRTLDIAKRLIDYGIHPPTIYFPLIVAEALMIEPTETESKRTLDHFIAAVRAILAEAAATPELVRGAPHTTPIGRLDEATAARRPVLVWPMGDTE
jgi:glycine dehydrogenase subunit 2